MPISVFDMFSIGIGPSSSHTVGPMRAARQFADELKKRHDLQKTERLKIELYGSLALTGIGHGTDKGILLGCEGYMPSGVDPNEIESIIHKIKETNLLRILNEKQIAFKIDDDLIFHKDLRLPFHSNGMRFTAYDSTGKELYTDVIYSTGGGFIIDHARTLQSYKDDTQEKEVPFPFITSEELLSHCQKNQMTIAEIVMENEKTWRSEIEIQEGLLNIWNVMKECVERGCHQEGILPGGLNLKRRAANLYRDLTNPNRKKHEAESMEWLNVWALAVGEENAAGGRVVTAPTNGSSGVIPSVINYYLKTVENANEEGIVTFLLVAGAMGILFKKGASISGAEMGCMGEVGVACSMAAAGFTAALGGSNLQIENAAEIGMEHHLGMTCDPILGLVQIPCIERNAMGAVEAVNASWLALRGDGTHIVSLDQVIETMRQTGNDMSTLYKETSLGGLAVNVPLC